MRRLGLSGIWHGNHGVGIKDTLYGCLMHEIFTATGKCTCKLLMVVKSLLYNLAGHVRPDAVAA